MPLRHGLTGNMGRKRDESIVERAVETRDLEKKRRSSREAMRRLRARERLARAAREVQGREQDNSGESDEPQGGGP